MQFDYELITVCAIAALAIMLIIDQRRKIVASRKRHRLMQDVLQGRIDPASLRAQADSQPPDPRKVKADRRYYYFVMTLLILVLLWSTYRIWTEA